MTVYLDNSATTPVCPEAAAAVTEALCENFGNPSSAHAPGRRARRSLEEARRNVAAALSCRAEEIYFTSGGTEGDNIAIFGACRQNRHFGKHIITTAAEHDAVLRPFAALENDGYEVTYLKPGKDGSVSAEDFAAAVRPDTVFASVMAVNNETGAVNDTLPMSLALKKANPRAVFHTDAVQAFCKTGITPKTSGADLITVSSHKIHGPKGCGALFIKSGVKISPVTKGGGQEGNIRPGTEATPAIFGFGAASKLGAAQAETSAAHFKLLRSLLLSRVLENVGDAVVIGGGADHILCLSLPGYRSEVLLNYLDGKGVYISKGSACKKGARSHVLTSMGIPARVIDGAVRISFSRYNTEEEVSYAADMIVKASKELIKV